MSKEDKKQIIESLERAYSTTNELLKDLDLNTLVYSNSNWRIRDILGHISTWNRQSAKSLNAFMLGGEYAIPDLEEDEDDFNEQEVLKQRELSTEKVLSQWHQSYEDFKKIILEIPDDKYPGHLLYPWGGEYGDISNLAKFMTEHDEQHREEILKVIQT